MVAGRQDQSGREETGKLTLRRRLGYMQFDYMAVRLECVNEIMAAREIDGVVLTLTSMFDQSLALSS